MPTRVRGEEGLAWRAEEACLNAWPAKRVVLVDGWLIRASGGASRRNNSVNPLRFGPRDPRPALAEAQTMFAALGQPLIWRVPAIAPGVDEILAGEGFALPEGETTTLHAALAGWRAPAAAAAALSDDPSAEWLSARAQMSDAGDADSAAYRETLSLIAGPRQFALERVDAEIVAIAYGALSRGLLVLESVATASAARRQGFGRRVVGALMSWGKAAGADGACLQVVVDNLPALRLYQGLGFDRELYRYHYRRSARE